MHLLPKHQKIYSIFAVSFQNQHKNLLFLWFLFWYHHNCISMNKQTFYRFHIKPLNFTGISLCFPKILSVNSMIALFQMPFFAEKQLFHVFLFVLNLNFFKNFHDKAYIRPPIFDCFRIVIGTILTFLWDYLPIWGTEPWFLKVPDKFLLICPKKNLFGLDNFTFLC